VDFLIKLGLGMHASTRLLTLEQVYGAITHYLAHRTEVDAYLQRNRAKFESLRLQARATHPLLYQRLEAETRDLQEV
jgi:hypothetical protein